MDERNEDSTVERALEALPVVEPPVDFVDRVVGARGAMDAASELETPPRRRRASNRVLVYAASACVLGCAVLAWHALRSGDVVPLSGAIAPSQRQTVTIGPRGVAVVEAGSALSWELAREGGVVARQPRGDVFYRVDPGGSFRVETAVGVVRVTGTCFRVEVESEEMKPSKQGVVGAAVGAAVAATIVVTVYEGKVLFAGSDGRTHAVEAGERLTLASDGRRKVEGVDDAVASSNTALDAPAEDLSREQLLARDREQRREISRLRERLSAANGPRAAGAGDGDGRPWFDPSTETLERFAEECRVRYDIPPFDMMGKDMQLPPELVSSLGLGDEEVAAMSRAFSKIRDSMTLEVRQLYLEATGDTEGADSLSLSAMGQELQHKSERGEAQRIHRRLARERAGLIRAPGDIDKRSPLERYYRLLGGVGDATEYELAQVVGSERAHQLRSELGGWGARMEFAGCDEEGEQTEDERR